MKSDYLLILLPIACWGIIILSGYKRGLSRRETFLSASIIWGVVLTFITESLSLFSALTQGWLAIAWGCSAVGASLTFFLVKKKGHSPRPISFSITDLAFSGAIVFLCLVILATALLYPPNNWDSMTYHMSRVVHWLQNRSVAHYPTHILRQIELNPWAEFAIAHFQALSGTDRFANLIQWFSMVGSTIGATLVARQLGARQSGQLLAAVLAATIPMGILQASSTQNDYVTAFWLLCFAWSGIRLMEKQDLGAALLAGASLGLAILTKGTAYLFALPFTLWFFWGIVRRPKKRVVLLVVGLALPVLILNAGHYGRNWALFSNPLGAGTRDFTNDTISVKAGLSNLVRNSAMHLSTPFDEANRGVEKGVAALHRLIGIGINDQRTTWPGSTFKIRTLMPHEDYSGNFFHALLAAICLGLIFFRQSVRRTSPLIMTYALCIATGFLLFCFILKWQPWHVRLHLPLFVLGAPVIGVVLANLYRPVQVIVAALLLTMSFPWAIWNISRPLLPSPRAIIDHFIKGQPLPLTILSADRMPQYFTNRPELWQPYSLAANLIKTSGAQNIGLKMDNAEAWEYPLWVLLENEAGKGPRIEHIDVNNPSRVLGPVDFHPDLTVKFDNAGYPGILWNYKPKQN